MTEAVVRGQHNTPATTEPAVVTWLRGRPRWMLPTALAVAVAVGVAIAIVLALSSSPKPPAFLGGTNSPNATSTQ